MDYAYEAFARAYAISGEKVECQKYSNLAEESGQKIKEKEDKDIFFSDLNSGPWNNMK
ncbi:MAG: hypothetical protein PHV06_06805 [bacterium]|nr:hypothetical protein [bacterium]